MPKLKKRGTKIISRRGRTPNRLLLEYDPGIAKRFLQAYAVGLGFYESAQIAGVSGSTMKKYLMEGAQDPYGPCGGLSREFNSVRNIQELKTLDAIRRMGEGLDTYEDVEIHYEYVTGEDGRLVVENGEPLKIPVKEVVRKSRARPDLRALQWRLERSNPEKYSRFGLERRMIEDNEGSRQSGIVRITDQSNTEEDFEKKAIENQSKIKSEMYDFTREWEKNNRDDG